MNLFFKHFHKTAFLPQFLLGMMAIFAFPEMQAIAANENEAETVINQSVTDYYQSADETEQPQSPFVAELEQTLAEMPLQAVVFCRFFAKYDRLYRHNAHSIRAGPVS